MTKLALDQIWQQWTTHILASFHVRPVRVVQIEQVVLHHLLAHAAGAGCEHKHAFVYKHRLRATNVVFLMKSEAS